MKQHLKDLSALLNDINNNPQNSMKFFTGPCKNNEKSKPRDDIKYILIRDILENVEFIQNNRQQADYSERISKILQDIDRKYQQTQNLCWRSHDHHFHATFKDYVNCPVTCLAELSEYFEKLHKELFSQ